MRGLQVRPAGGELVESSADFSAYVRYRSQALLRVAFLLTGEVNAAEDLLQTALARVYPRWDRLDHAEGNVHGYVLRTLVNCGRSTWRRDRYDAVPVAALPEEPVAERTGEVVDRELLVRVLRLLPGRQRTALVLRYLEDLSEAQTAAVMCCSTGSVKTHTSRGLAALRTMLADAGESSARPAADPKRT
jgi:RNA polymerase sigma-70 factor (sigma-E family)